MNKFFILLLILFLLNSNSALAEITAINANPIRIISEKELCDVKKYHWIIYDSVCPYCRQASKHIKDLDWEGKFKFISYRDPLTYKMFPNLTKEECEKDVHMVTPDGKVLVGYQVFRTVIDNLTATKLLNPLLKNNYAETKLNEIYDKMVKERSCYYNKTGTCDLKNRKNSTETKEAKKQE